MKIKYMNIVGLVAVGVFLFSCGKPTSIKELGDCEYKIDSILSLLTLEEKVNMIHASSSFTSGGVPRLGIPELIMSDGPHGIRREHGRDWTPDEGIDDSVSYLPTGITLAATWNPELGYEFGKVLGREARHRGKDIILGPGVNIIRTPLNGRNFEYLTEDPYLNSVMAVGYIKGVQDQGVSACIKHYIANNQETNRKIVNVNLSERALREIYLPVYQAAINEADVHSVMGAYNKFRGQYCSHNSYLINNVLKGELGFKGILISDWAAVHDTKEAVLNGTDIEMGTDLTMWNNRDYSKFFLGDTVISLVKSGEISDSVINEKVRRILRIMYKSNKFGKRKKGAVNTREHQQTALKIAEEGIVLLKNNGLLPFNKEKINSIAVIGDNAIRHHSAGGGSSQVKSKYEVTPLDGIVNLVGQNTKITFSKGYLVSGKTIQDKKLIDEAVKAASDAEVAIVVGGFIHSIDTDIWDKNAYDSEGNDKADLTLPFGQNELIKAVSSVNPNTIVILYGGGASDMSYWIDNVNGILQVWYPGMEGGNAIANILFGKTNPSGKLPVTFPGKLTDHPAHHLGEYPGENMEVNYKEDIFVGYRYFDSYKVEPQYCFGHGLSYTTFNFSNINVSCVGDQIEVKFEIENTGKLAGSEVAQIYFSKKDTKIKRATKELKAFKKINLNPGQKEAVTLSLKESDFMYFDEESGNWKLEPGDYKILIGSSSRDIKLESTLKL